MIETDWLPWRAHGGREIGLPWPAGTQRGAAIAIGRALAFGYIAQRHAVAAAR